MSNIGQDPYAVTCIGMELKTLETFTPLTDDTVGGFLNGDGNDFASYHPVFLDFIEQVKTNRNRNFAYNSEVKEVAKAAGYTGPKLSLLVYNSQRYHEAIQTASGFDAHLDSLKAEGFILINEAQAKALLTIDTLPAKAREIPGLPPQRDCITPRLTRYVLPPYFGY